MNTTLQLRSSQATLHRLTRPDRLPLRRGMILRNANGLFKVVRINARRGICELETCSVYPVRVSSQYIDHFTSREWAVVEVPPTLAERLRVYWAAVRVVLACLGAMVLIIFRREEG